MRDAREGMSDYGGWQSLALAQTRVQRREHDESSQSAMPPCCWAFRRAGSANCPPGQPDTPRSPRPAPARIGKHAAECRFPIEAAPASRPMYTSYGLGSISRNECHHPGYRASRIRPSRSARSPQTGLAASERCQAAAGSAGLDTEQREGRPLQLPCDLLAVHAVASRRRGGRSLPVARSHSSRSRRCCAWLRHFW
jgi:hypothetical protein